MYFNYYRVKRHSYRIHIRMQQTYVILTIFSGYRELVEKKLQLDTAGRVV